MRFHANQEITWLYLSMMEGAKAIRMARRCLGREGRSALTMAPTKSKRFEVIEGNWSVSGHTMYFRTATMKHYLLLRLRGFQPGH